jgi:hypothetical protein
MESLLILVPLVISIGNCIFTGCVNTRLSNRVQQLEHNLTTHTHQYNPIPPSYTQPPPPSAPPGYGYQFYPGDPNNQGLNVV